MSVGFLSAEHLDAATEAMADDPEVAAKAEGANAKINYVISDGPEGDFEYHIQVADGVASVARGGLDDPDVNLKSSYDTAAKVSRGEQSSQMAVMTGKIKVKGSVGVVMKNMALMQLMEGHINSVEVDY